MAGFCSWSFAKQNSQAQRAKRVEQRKGLKRYPFAAAGGKRYKRKARFPGRGNQRLPRPGNAPKKEE
jgi:hypothetical protein